MCVSVCWCVWSASCFRPMVSMCVSVCWCVWSVSCFRPKVSMCVSVCWYVWSVSCFRPHRQHVRVCVLVCVDCIMLSTHGQHVLLSMLVCVECIMLSTPWSACACLCVGVCGVYHAFDPMFSMCVAVRCLCYSQHVLVHVQHAPRLPIHRLLHMLSCSIACSVLDLHFLYAWCPLACVSCSCCCCRCFLVLCLHVLFCAVCSAMAAMPCV
jgi:hypothetical protein